MPYLIIEDFRGGLDRRKLPVASPQGSLQELTNAHITRGGEIEKALAFVATYSLPVGQTFGFDSANGERWVWGSVDTPAVPVGITYQRLQHPGAFAMTGVLCSEFFDGKPFVIAQFSNGDILPFYDGALVTDFNVGSGAFTAGEKPVFALTHREKLYVIYKSILGFSGIDEPERWQAGGAPVAVGFGFKNMSNQSAGSETLTGLGRYQDLMAVFARRNTQIWYLDPDPLQNVQRQLLPNIGTLAPGSVVSFGDSDVFFLADSGIRSLRARDSSNKPGVSDVGTPIDEQLLEYLATLTETERAAAVGALEPLSGRYLLAVGTKIFVFSYFPSSRISAWSVYEPGFTISRFAVDDGRVWAREGDTIHLLGGADGATYDSSKVTVELPYIDGRAIATFKDFTGLDIACQGLWTVEVNTDPNHPDVWSKVATIKDSSFVRDALGIVGHSPVIKMRLTNEAPSPARLSKVVLHYNTAEAT